MDTDDMNELEAKIMYMAGTVTARVINIIDKGLPENDGAKGAAAVAIGSALIATGVSMYDEKELNNHLKYIMDSIRKLVMAEHQERKSSEL